MHILSHMTHFNYILINGVDNVDLFRFNSFDTCSERLWRYFQRSGKFKWVAYPWCVVEVMLRGLTSRAVFWFTHWGQDKMADIFRTIFSNAFSWMNCFEFPIKFDWSLFLRVQLTITQHWFRWWLGAEQTTSHYLNQRWPRLVTPICVTQPQWITCTSKVCCPFRKTSLMCHNWMPKSYL